jgi:hypothetical protein
MSREKVEIPPDKPYIVLQGESNRITLIQWGDFGDSERSATFNLYADNFVARDITFKVKPLIFSILSLQKYLNKKNIYVLSNFLSDKENEFGLPLVKNPI